MEFDLRTCDSAYHFILDFMDMTPDEYITEFCIECENDFETFWNRNLKRIKVVDISDLRIMAFHVLGSLDDCKEIKKRGLINLQEILSGKTILSQLLCKSGILFNISARTVSCNGKTYDIDYDCYRSRHFLTGTYEHAKSVARRVYFDFCVNGFLLNDDVFNYGTRIHERPEFLMTLAKLFPEVEQVEHYWESHATSYRIDFFATIKQLHRYVFDLDEMRDPPYDGWLDLNDDMKIKKWMLSHAINRSRDNLSEKYLFAKDNVIIPPNQIISYTVIKKHSKY